MVFLCYQIGTDALWMHNNFLIDVTSDFVFTSISLKHLSHKSVPLPPKPQARRASGLFLSHVPSVYHGFASHIWHHEHLDTQSARGFLSLCHTWCCVCATCLPVRLEVFLLDICTDIWNVLCVLWWHCFLLHRHRCIGMWNFWGARSPLPPYSLPPTPTPSPHPWVFCAAEDQCGKVYTGSISTSLPTEGAGCWAASEGRESAWGEGGWRGLRRDEAMTEAQCPPQTQSPEFSKI